MIIAFLWSLLIIIKIIFPESIGKAQYNGYYVGFFAIICYSCNPDVRIGIISLLSFAILFFCSKDLIHPLGDLTTIIMTLSAFDIALSSKLNRREHQFILWIVSFFILIDVIGISFPNLYSGDNIEGRRYDGILHSSNVTATVFCLCQIALSELKKQSRRKTTLLNCNFALFVIMLFITKTRSMLLFLPYWGIQYYYSINKKLFWLLMTVIGILLIKSLVSIQQDLRLEGDGSYLTRLFLYENLIKGIISHPLIPHGSYAANELSKILTMNDDFAPHNDFLMYIYDWGFIFFILVGYIWLSYNRKIRFSWLNLTIIFGWSSSCLHNILLLPQVLFVFLMILNIQINSLDKSYGNQN